MKRDYINEKDWKPAEIEGILDRAAEVKKRPADYRQALSGKTLAMIFEKSSTRTRVSFEAGMFQLGGLAMFLSSRDLQLGRGEPVSDTASSASTVAPRPNCVVRKSSLRVATHFTGRPRRRASQATSTSSA